MVDGGWWIPDDGFLITEENRVVPEIPYHKNRFFTKIVLLTITDNCFFSSCRGGHPQRGSYLGWGETEDHRRYRVLHLHNFPLSWRAFSLSPSPSRPKPSLWTMAISSFWITRNHWFSLHLILSWTLIGLVKSDGVPRLAKVFFVRIEDKGSEKTECLREQKNGWFDRPLAVLNNWAQLA